MATLGEIRRDFESRLSNDWHELAVQLDIPEIAKDKWGKGYEAAGIWNWLNARRKLKSLAPALIAVNRQDLASLVESVPSHHSPLFGSAGSLSIFQTLFAIFVIFAVLIGVLGRFNFLDNPWKQPEKHRQRQLLGGKMMTLDSTSPLNDIYRDAPTLGKESLTKSIDPLSDNGWFGFVFLSNQLLADFDKPTIEIEIQDAAGQSIHNKSDLIDIHWLAPDKNHESEEREVRGLRLDKEKLSDQNPTTVSAGTYIVIVYRYRDLRVQEPRVNVFIY